MSDRQDKERTINLLLDILKIFYNDKDISITIEQAKRVSMVSKELGKLGVDLKERLK